jgi:hypothetical protein
LIALGELDDHGRGVDAVQRALAQMRWVGHRVAPLRHPLRVLDDLLDLHRARHRVDHGGPVAQRHVLVEAPRRRRERGLVEQRGHPIQQREADQRPE